MSGTGVAIAIGGGDHGSKDYQGRQQHGWFGHGTRSQDSNVQTVSEGAGGAPPDRFVAVVRGAVGAVPAGDRKAYEAALGSSGEPKLATALRIWSTAPATGQAFHDAYLNDVASPQTADRLQALARQIRAAGTANDQRQASTDLAGLIAGSRSIATARFAETAAVRALALHDLNVQQLADIIHSEAGGLSIAPQTAVGATVLNRMVRNGTNQVEDVRRGYAYNHPAPPNHLAPTIARALLDGQTSDPTKGATHFYTPRAMPKKGENTGGADVGGKLESVPGVVTRDKPPRPIENYRPSFAGGKSFNEIQVPNVQAKDFKFFRKAGDGPVR